MKYWNELMTKKSWDLLIKLNKLPIRFILIGGWAAYLWSQLHKSKDIDIIIKDFKDLDYLKKNYDLKKNARLKKYEIIVEGIDVDIYVPHFSRLALPVEEIVKQTVKIENMETVKPEVLLILKQGAELERKNTVKGKKDQIDILTLITHIEINWQFYFDLLKKHKLGNYVKRLKEIFNEFKEIKYLELNPREFKLRKEEILRRLKKVK